MTIRLYGAYRSTCTKRVLTTLHEKGLKFDFQPVDMTKGEHKVRSKNNTSTSKRWRPLVDSQIPRRKTTVRCHTCAGRRWLQSLWLVSCVHDELWSFSVDFLVESRAICRYLELKYKGKGTQLIPTDLQAQGLFEQAASIEASNYDPYVSGIAFEKVFKKWVVTSVHYAMSHAISSSLSFTRRKGLGEPDEAKIASLREQLNAKLDVYEKILSKQPYLGGQVSSTLFFLTFLF